MGHCNALHEDAGEGDTVDDILAGVDTLLRGKPPKPSAPQARTRPCTRTYVSF